MAHHAKYLHTENGLNLSTSNERGYSQCQLKVESNKISMNNPCCGYVYRLFNDIQL